MSGGASARRRRRGGGRGGRPGRAKPGAGSPAGPDEYAPGPGERTVRDANGNVLEVPDDWALLPPGDAALTRRVKAAGPHWTVAERRGRKRFGRGVWAPAATIAELGRAREAEREDPAYTRRLEQGRARRARAQEVYVGEFTRAVEDFLAFDARHRALGAEVAKAIAVHATPVGSGTVARTERIPVERRAEAATIAWLRHQTTAYDSMKIARVKGRRREVRRELAARSRELLDAYRRGDGIAAESCLLTAALERKDAE